MFIVFRPGRILGGACLIAFSGSTLIYGALYHSPYPGRPLYPALIFGLFIEALGAWIAFTALRYIWTGLRIFFQGPQR